MSWPVFLGREARKRSLSEKAESAFQLLLREIEESGPVRGNWPGFGKLRKNCYHCHLQKGRPTYVAVWRVAEKRVEVTYAGTHEKADYKRRC